MKFVYEKKTTLIHSYEKKKSFCLCGLLYSSKLQTYSRTMLGQREANFSQRPTDLDNLFIINCVSSFFRVNFLLGSMSLHGKISTESSLSVTLSRHGFVSVITFVFSTFVFTEASEDICIMEA